MRYTVEATTPLRRHCEAEDLAEQAEALESGLPSRPASTERRIPAGRDPSGRAVGTTMPSRRHSGANINRRMFKPYPQARRAALSPPLGALVGVGCFSPIRRHCEGDPSVSTVGVFKPLRGHHRTSDVLAQSAGTADRPETRESGRMFKPYPQARREGEITVVSRGIGQSDV